ncbi:DUF2735 domain-containing protein [Pseudolabrys taiwanensis]|uniref:DUF2735 domain-containing protein n=1 Tax=Pseudolabrys taiwanensis TaxID=331696 RepID=A0A345ZTF2_9HYPH|nr:DUF2735 domain-containing protein [Pseudolabrys taiwanensis]AXK80199.1 DUF2735 domain-containing protein [Pseudolabrys taiwanensis]
MTTNVHRESAKIYAFPARGRFASGASYERPSTDDKRMVPSRAVAAALGSAWYHEEALRDADRTRKN